MAPRCTRPGPRKGSRTGTWSGTAGRAGWAWRRFLFFSDVLRARAGAAAWEIADGLGSEGSGHRARRSSRVTMPRASSRSVGADPVADLACVVGRQVVQRQVAALLDVVHLDAGYVGLDATEDGHLVAVVGDVVLVLAPLVAGDRDDRDQDREHGQYGDPARPGEPARRPGRVAHLLGVELVLLVVLADGVELTGVAGAGRPAGAESRAGAAPRRRPRPASGR